MEFQFTSPKASQEYPWAAKMKFVYNLQKDETSPIHMEDETPIVS